VPVQENHGLKPAPHEARLCQSSCTLREALTMQLRELEADGMTRRTVYAEVPPRVAHALTPFGERLAPPPSLLPGDASQ